MDEIILPYGRKEMRLKTPSNLLGIIEPGEGSEVDIPSALKETLNNPIGLPPLKRLLKKEGKVAIIIPDKTRRNPSKVILPLLIEELKKSDTGSIDIVIANAAHNQHPFEESDANNYILKGIGVYNHNSRKKKDSVTIGKMPISPSLPQFFKKDIRINRVVASADLVIVIGTILPHLMAGFSGGAKGIIPGVSGINTIALNHFLMYHPSSRLGIIEDNIFRQDIERGASFLKNVFILNAVYDRRKKVVGLFGGDMVKAHREGVKLCMEIGKTEIKKADIVIAADSFPETINIYQTLKLIAPAAKMVNSGGVIIIAGECAEGEGELTLFNRIFYWDLLKKYFPSIEKIHIYLLSETGKTKRFPFFIKPISTIEEGIEKANKKFGLPGSVLILSGAGLLIPGE